MVKGKTPLTNQHKEKFCKYYSTQFWGDPCGAVRAAGYNTAEQDAAEVAESLFDDEGVRERIVYLRQKQTEQLVADEAWIRELLIDIASHAGKDSDRIRALTSLAKVIGCTGKKSATEAEPVQMMLPFFEGEWD